MEEEEEERQKYYSFCTQSGTLVFPPQARRHEEGLTCVYLSFLAARSRPHFPVFSCRFSLMLDEGCKQSRGSWPLASMGSWGDDDNDDDDMKTFMKMTTTTVRGVGMRRRRHGDR